jgi:hypothetical protein
MKPNRVYSLTVTPLTGLTSSSPSEGVVVVRPVIPGALVAPAEERLEVKGGNVVVFQVTPLAKGTIPNARVEIHAAGQPTEEIPLRIRVQNQRLTLLMLALTFLLPWVLFKITLGSWAAEANNRQEQFVGATQLPANRFKEAIKAIPPVPLLTKNADWMPLGLDKYNLGDLTTEGLRNGYQLLMVLVSEYHAIYYLFAILLAFTLILCFMRRARSAKRFRYLEQPLGSFPAGPPRMLEPM